MLHNIAYRRNSPSKTQPVTAMPLSSDPAPMEGHGAYNRSSCVQAAGSAPAVPLLECAAETLLLANAPDPIVIADYGSSEGRNSLAPMRTAIAALRKRVGADRAISVVHTDMPGNDFTTLFQTLETDPESYARGDTAVFPSAVGRSFYQQILPTGSVTLGWSSWSIQWLSRIPGPVQDHVYADYSHDFAARTAYKAQSADDWQAFLAARGKELRPGGRLVVLTVAVGDDGDIGYRPMVDIMYYAILDLADEGFVRSEEVHRMVIPVVGRSRVDFAAPFAANGHYAGLSIEHIDVFLGADPIWEAYQRDGDARKYGGGWAAFIGAAAVPTLALGLDGGRDDPRAALFATKMAERMTARFAADPQPTPLPLARLVLAKDAV
jgi:hypothetical protein